MFPVIDERAEPANVEGVYEFGDGAVVCCKYGRACSCVSNSETWLGCEHLVPCLQDGTIVDFQKPEMVERWWNIPGRNDVEPQLIGNGLRGGYDSENAEPVRQSDLVHELELLEV